MEKVKTLQDGIAVEQDEPVPLVMHITFPRGSGMILSDGMPMIQHITSRFVCIDQLPPELCERILTAVNYLSRV